MSNPIPVKISGEGARRLADLHSVLHDLQWVQVACVLAAKHMPDGTASASMVEALQASALIRYCRSFEGGSSTRFALATEMLDDLPEELWQAHYEFTVLRDKYIAHSEDDMLWNVPMAYVERDTATGKHWVSWLKVEHCSMVELSRESLTRLYELARALLTMVQDEIEHEEARALAIMKEMSIGDSDAVRQQPDAPKTASA